MIFFKLILIFIFIGPKLKIKIRVKVKNIIGYNWLNSVTIELNQRRDF